MISLGVWILMLFADLWLPIFLVVYGSIYSKKTPADINGSNGYKTARSKLSQETWEFANRYSARIERIVGWVLLVLSLAVLLLFLRGKSDAVVSNFGVGILLVQVVVFIVAIIPPTEAALKKNFDENGRRK
jgi:hypothetical protein